MCVCDISVGLYYSGSRQGIKCHKFSDLYIPSCLTPE
jgi:hypothetical protein